MKPWEKMLAMRVGPSSRDGGRKSLHDVIDITAPSFINRTLGATLYVLGPVQCGENGKRQGTLRVRD